MEKQIKEHFSNEVLNKAISLYDIQIVACKEIRSNNNFIYEINDDKESFILRITHQKQKTKELLIAEHDLINYYNVRHIKTCLPIVSKEGEIVNTVNLHGGYYSILYEKINGVQYSMTAWNRKLFFKWGELVGRTHKIAEDYDPNGLIHRRLDWHYDFLAPEKYLPKSKEEVFRKIIEFKKRIEKYNSNQEQLQLIHNDINPSNFIEDDNELTLFDFDDCHFDYLLSDIANAMLYVLDIPILYASRNLPMSRIELGKLFFDSFFSGYYKHTSNKLDVSFLNLLILRRIANLYVDFYRSYDIEKFIKIHPLVFTAFENAILNEEAIIDDSIL